MEFLSVILLNTGSKKLQQIRDKNLKLMENM